MRPRKNSKQIDSEKLAQKLNLEPAVVRRVLIEAQKEMSVYGCGANYTEGPVVR